ncbi:hypothetical protein [Clostridium sp.]
MRKKTIAIIFLFIMMYSIVVSAEGFKYAEIFDPKQDKVVKVVQMNKKIHKIVSSSIKDVDVLYGKYNPLTDDGYAIKIPLYPAVKVQGKCLNALVNEVYIIIPENVPPFFMIFENSDKLLCFPFKGDIDKLSRALDFELK